MVIEKILQKGQIIGLRHTKKATKEIGLRTVQGITKTWKDGGESSPRKKKSSKKNKIQINHVWRSLKYLVKSNQKQNPKTVEPTAMFNTRANECSNQS